MMRPTSDESLMIHLKFNCSHCGQRLECDPQYGGRQIPCPACQALTVVPAVPGTAAPSSQKSGMTFVPEGWQKPDADRPASSPQKSGMTCVPESWRTPPPPAKGEEPKT
jgi:DNA-directed RNA polymerase subunit RPC12/RpoP